MQKAKFVGGMLLLMIVVGFVGGELGITQSAVSAIEVTKPESSGGFFDTLNNIVAPFIILWDLLVGFFQIVTFQATGIPTTVNTIIFIPIAAIMGWLIIGVIKG